MGRAVLRPALSQLATSVGSSRRVILCLWPLPQQQQHRPDTREEEEEEEEEAWGQDSIQRRQ